MYHDHTVHMSHLGRSGTLLDPPNTQVSNPHATVLYCYIIRLFGYTVNQVMCVRGWVHGWVGGSGWVCVGGGGEGYFVVLRN